MGAFVLLIGLPTTRGQSIKPNTLNTSGGTQTIGRTEFDWSVGEAALVNTFYGPTGKNIIVTQGLLQNEMSTPVKIANTNLAQHLQVFPNPANSIVNLQYTSPADGMLGYRLMDMAGKVIIQHSGEVKQGIALEQLNISELAAATYLLEVSFKDNSNIDAMTSYKIEKLK